MFILTLVDNLSIIGQIIFYLYTEKKFFIYRKEVFKNLARYRFENNFIGHQNNYVEHLNMSNLHKISNELQYPT